MARRHAGLRLGVVPRLNLLPVALLRVPPAALWIVHCQRACLVGEVRHVIYRLLHLALLQAKTLSWQVRICEEKQLLQAAAQASSSHSSKGVKLELRTSPGCLSLMPFSQPAGNHTAHLGRKDREPAESGCTGRKRQDPAAPYKHAPCHSGGMEVGSCPDGQSRSPYTTQRCLPARVMPTVSEVAHTGTTRRVTAHCRSRRPGAAHQTVPSCAGSTCCQSCPSQPGWRWAHGQRLLACVCRISAVRLQCLAGALVRCT